MVRFLNGGRLIVASHNGGKVKEIRDLLTPFNVCISSAADLSLPEPEENGDCFIANAKIKALAAAKSTNLPALADDSGLGVEALDGAPGIYSARWAGPKKDFAAAMARIEKELGHTDNLSAQFVCALALAWPDGHCESFEGRVTGALTFPARGTKGFGYDPIFIPDGHYVTFAEMEPSAKHAISHRADAFRQLVSACFK